MTDIRQNPTVLDDFNRADETPLSGGGNWAQLDSEQHDTSSIHSVSTNTDRLNLGAVALGYWAVYAIVRFAANATGARLANIKLNGSTTIGLARIGAASGSLATHVAVYCEREVTDSGDYVVLEVSQDSGGNLDVQGGAGLTIFGCRYLGTA